MNKITQNLWLIPILPAVAAAVTSLFGRQRRALSAGLSIASMAAAFLASLAAFTATVHAGGARAIETVPWFQMGSTWLQIGWVLDPLSASMLLMVTFVSLLVFVYSVGYMQHDENFTRFFCFLSLFASAMLGLIIANSLLLLFICWELVGLASYLLIGFWYQRPAAAAAAKKAFITTRIGDLALLIGMVWLYARSGSLLFYDHGAGCLEQSTLLQLATHTTIAGMAISAAIGLLVFCGAAGKSGQFPLHVWLPDAMEGPTPVSALIHAATMVAAGVFLIARMFPLMTAHIDAGLLSLALAPTTALKVVTWVGAITALFAASIAVAQDDIKRILAYSTVSQLGYMMMGLGVGGVEVGMLHLLAHAFFKALLFLGAGSVIHGLHDEQNMRRMGGLRHSMPVTFITYAIGMLALSGFPLLFSGFWTKDEILHAAHRWDVSQIPFLLGLIGALLTAFYMTRQVCYVFLGKPRTTDSSPSAVHSGPHESVYEGGHESPAIMTLPLVVLAACAILLSAVVTPLWPWLQDFLRGDVKAISAAGLLPLMLLSSAIVFTGLALGGWLYRRVPAAGEPDPLQRFAPSVFSALHNRLYVDEFYEATVLHATRSVAYLCDFFDRRIFGGAVWLFTMAFVALSHLSRWFDSGVVNAGFDGGCSGAVEGGRFVSTFENGQVQTYLRWIAVALAALALLLFWGMRA